MGSVVRTKPQFLLSTSAGCRGGHLLPELLLGQSSVDGLRSGALEVGALCRAGARAKSCVNMGASAEAGASRLYSESRTGPGRKRSRQKAPRSTVVGLRL